MKTAEQLFDLAKKLYHTEGKEYEAIDAFKTLLSSFPNHIQGLENMSTMQCKVCDFDGALDSIDAAISFEPENPDLWHHKSLTLNLIEHFTYSSSYFLDEQTRECHEIKRFDTQEKLRIELLETINKQLTFFPLTYWTRPNLVYSKGIVLKSLKKYDEAIDTLKSSIPLFQNVEKKPRMNPISGVYMQIAQIYREKKDLKSAIENYDLAIAEGAGEIILTHKANAYKEFGDLVTANKLFDEFIILASDQFEKTKDAAYCFQILGVYESLAKFNAAIDVLDKLDQLENKREYLIDRIAKKRKELNEKLKNQH